MSVPVGAFASKSRSITAVNCSSVLRTEKSSSPKKFAGNTRRPCRLTTNGFTRYLRVERLLIHRRPALFGRVVVGLAAAVSSGIGAVVRLIEVDRQQRDRQHEEHQHAGDPPGPWLHADPAPPAGEGTALMVLFGGHGCLLRLLLRRDALPVGAGARRHGPDVVLDQIGRGSWR